MLKDPIFIGGENARQIFGEVEDSLADLQDNSFRECLATPRIISCEELLNLRGDILRPILDDHFGNNAPKVPLYADINTTFVIASVASNVVKYKLKNNMELLREFPDKIVEKQSS